MYNTAKKACIHFILLAGCYCSVSFAIAQDIKRTEVDKEESYFKFSGSYLSNSVYNGRKDSLVTPYITPVFGYYNKTGVYATASLSYLASAAQSRVDLYSFELGYNFSFSDNFIGSISANKSFYNAASTAITSDIKGIVGTSLTYDFNFVQLTAGADVLFAQNPDIAMNIGLAHAFTTGDDDHLFTITPTAVTYLSTLNFYEGYTNRKAGKKAKAVIPNLVSVTSTTSVNNNKFTLMDYELSLPVSYDAKSFGLFLTPTYAIPKNPIYTTTTNLYVLKNRTHYSETLNSTPQTEKQLANIFYIEIGGYIKF